MDEQMQGQVQDAQDSDERQWMWIDNIYDWQVSEHVNYETGEKFWSIKLPSETFIDVAGEKVDVSKHQFTVDWEPAVSRGEPGTPKCMRGVHLPLDWNVTLKKWENITPNASTPNFKEVSRVEGVSPKQLNDGLAERTAAWRQTHRKQSQEQDHEKPGMGTTSRPPRQAEPAL